MIEVYSKPSCPQCTWVKKLLTKLGLEYRETDVTADPEAYRYVFDLCAAEGIRPAVPVTVSGDTVIFGFHDEKLKALAKET